MCDLETSRMRRPWPAWGSRAIRKKFGLTISQVMTLQNLAFKKIYI